MGPGGKPVVTIQTAAHTYNMRMGNDHPSASSNRGAVGQVGVRGGRGFAPGYGQSVVPVATWCDERQYVNPAAVADVLVA